LIIIATYCKTGMTLI